jgi:2-oxoglutarate dehydrogenase complex dehydrogenase (E1) component-like enzyme
MKALIDRITDLEAKSIVIGMPHRGERYGQRYRAL